ncbi:hypothetical protein L6164_003099 [Bauhinia variegata]|uniref:Uncharacterized protein n=1 Tax=Bauhinia variegata TaxID=167791 RepID=A0ACB9Q0U5_BAUVA|nr:hypothetical protein L6164_003099 [Bauhinia variegata]
MDFGKNKIECSKLKQKKSKRKVKITFANHLATSQNRGLFSLRFPGASSLPGFQKIMSSQSANEDCLGWAARDPSGVLSPYKFSRRAVGDDDVHIKITYCGVCYADVVWTRNKHNDSKYPVVPGHEIAGIVEKVGSKVQGFSVGDRVGVGTYVNSCRNCEHCNDRLENFCGKGVYTFNGVDADGTVTKGGYSSYIVIHERYCFKIPKDYPLASAAPLLCAGISVYAPMMRHNMNEPGKSLGVIGLGGLGHMAVKFGKAFGLNVTVFSTSMSKKEEALNVLGADKFVVSSDQEQMKASANSVDFIVDTASGDHPFDAYLSLLKKFGVLVLVGFPSEVKFSPASLLLGAKTVSGSVTGGTKQIQEMINFCATKKIYPNIEVIPIQYANEALERLINRDVKHRFVIDIENTLKEE